MGAVILRGLLRASKGPNAVCSRFTVSVSSDKTVRHLEDNFKMYSDRLHLVRNRNVEAARNADAVMMCFPPDQIHAVLREDGMADAVRGKLLVSILAGISRDNIVQALLGNNSSATNDEVQSQTEMMHVIRAMPSIGAQAEESATMIVEEKPQLPDKLQQLAMDIFKVIGRLHLVQPHLFAPLTAIAAASHALLSVSIDAFIDAGVSKGIPREQTLALVASCWRGYSTLMNRGDDPSELKKALLTPNGFTPFAMVSYDQERVRSGVERTLVKTLELMESNTSKNKSQR